MSFYINCGNVTVTHSVKESPGGITADSICHGEYEILYVVQGSGKYIVEGEEHPIRPRSVILTRPFAYHNVTIEGAVYEYYSVRFSKDAASGAAVSMLERLTEGEGNMGKYYPATAVSDACAGVFERFEAAVGLPDEERAAYAGALVCELIIFLSASEGEKMLDSEDELGARVIRYINGNIHRNISLDRLARHFFVSKYYLCRAFKKHNGISVHGYINRKRVMYAKQLIEAGETASGAAYKVGFGDYSAFYRAYVKVVGTSPTAEKSGMGKI